MAVKGCAEADARPRVGRSPDFEEGFGGKEDGARIGGCAASGRPLFPFPQKPFLGLWEAGGREGQLGGLPDHGEAGHGNRREFVLVVKDGAAEDALTGLGARRREHTSGPCSGRHSKYRIDPKGPSRPGSEADGPSRSDRNGSRRHVVQSRASGRPEDFDAHDHGRAQCVRAREERCEVGVAHHPGTVHACTLGSPWSMGGALI
jgi:hypothetical protein